ncbi:MAG TPA: putative porin [Sedimentisphaerales bacterium]|nr:putative porin [Sedimentisphaerales bacterium]HRS11056.1 putative porin [Sedimentisphaerales bacterium]HRV47736.1 putative porin [Sedimentisphaerales bacterium]
MTSTCKPWACVLLPVGAGFVFAAEQPSAPSATSAESVTPKSESQTLLESLPAWLRSMKISGDFRYRHERADDETKTTERDRHRIRARLIVSSKVNDQVDATVGLASGTDESPTNTNQDLKGAFSSKDLWLDLAFINYHPAAVEGLDVFAGKIQNLYYSPGNSDLLFDTDVNPEGIAATCGKDLNDTVSIFGTFGGYYVEERSTDVDTSLWGIQGGLTWKVPQVENMSMTAGGRYFDYGNLQG